MTDHNEDEDGYDEDPVEADDDEPVVAPLIREWHTMTAVERAEEWSALVEWVVWIHDLYELAREERLPLCWPRHPGLVEELRSLKAWRDAVYDNPDAASAPHTARSWHGELRQTIAAAITFWAPGCRTGHTDAPPLVDAYPDLAEQWQQIGPPLRDSAPQPSAPMTMTHAEMVVALDAGRARPHSRAMPHYVKLGDTWWTRTSDGTTWDRCVDPGHHARLDATSERLRAADASLDKFRRS